MTQQPVYYPPQVPPGYGQQPYAPPPVQQPVQQPYAPYPGFPPVQPAPPQQPLARGTLDDFYSQPSGGSGKSISWQNKPEGTTYVGIVTRDVGNGDIRQQTDFVTKAPLFYSDGRPKFTMNVPLAVQPSQEFPEGEATWYVKGQARDELVRAMAEAGVTGAPRAGALIEVRLVQRKPSSRGLNPTNIFAVRYVPDPSGTGAPSPAPVQQQVPVGQPVQQQVPQAPPPQQPQQPLAWVQPGLPPQPVAPTTQPQQPAPPAGLSPEQQALMAQMGAAQAAQ